MKKAKQILYAIIVVTIIYFIVSAFFYVGEHSIESNSGLGQPRRYYDYSTGIKREITFPSPAILFPRIIYVIMTIQIVLLKRNNESKWLTPGFIFFVLASIAAIPAFLLVNDIYKQLVTGLSPFLAVPVSLCLLYQVIYWIYLQINLFFPKLNEK